MKKEFILNQTSIPEKRFNSSVLVGNWYEEKCDPSSTFSNFYQERKIESNASNNTTLKQETFIKSSQSWLNFQQTPQNHFQTTNQLEHKHPDDQTRNSVLKPFIVKKSNFEKDQKALNDYREKWTKGSHCFDRIYGQK